MDGLRNWALLGIAAGVLLSPVFGFLTAILVEALVCTIKEGGVPALAALAAAGVIGRLLWRRFSIRRLVGKLADQA